MPYLLSWDAGTTSLKGVLFTTDGQAVAGETEEYHLFTPSADMVEVDCEIYWQAACKATRRLLETSRIPPSEIAAVGITSQGETLTILDGQGNPLRRSIVWLDNRSQAQAGRIARHFGLDEVYTRTGQQEIVATWPATKILWLQEHEPEVLRGTHRFLMVEDYLLFRLTGRYATDRALCASTLYFDMTTGRWWPEMLRFLGVREGQLPELHHSGEAVDTVQPAVARELGLGPDTLVTTGPIDQVAGAVGAGNIAPGIVTETTGAALALCASVDEPLYDPRKRMALNGHAVDGRFVLFPWEPTAGMVLRWFRDHLGGRLDYDALCREAASVPPGAEGLTVLPHLAGAGCPDPDPGARGAFWGLTLGHGRGHLVRAILESVAFMLRGNLELLEELGAPVDDVRSLGGATRSDLWLQIKADVCGRDLVIMECEEAASLGVAMLASVAAGIWPDLEEARCRMVRARKTVFCDTDQSEIYHEAYARYCRLRETERSWQCNLSTLP